MTRVKFDEDLEYLSKNVSERNMMISATSSSIDNFQSLVGEKGGMSRLEFSRDLTADKPLSLLKTLKKIIGLE